MSNATSSQPQHEVPPFDPVEMWSRFAQDGISRMQSFYDELASLEAKTYARAKTATDQLADLASESINYWVKLAGEWRQITLDATRRSAEAFKFKV
jgi:hypothetical protein